MMVAGYCMPSAGIEHGLWLCCFGFSVFGLRFGNKGQLGVRCGSLRLGPDLGEKMVLLRATNQFSGSKPVEI